MRKSLMFIMLGIISFLGINSVSADTFTSSNFFIDFDTYINDYNTYEENINYLINYWEDNFSQDYPYYGIIDFWSGTYVGEDKPVFILYYTNNNEVYISDNSIVMIHNGAISYNVNKNSYVFSDVLPLPYIYGAGSIKSFRLLSSNGLIYKASSNFDKISFPSYFSTESSLMIENFEISDGDTFPSIMSLYDGSYLSDLTSSYTEINLNNYSYIALSLKDYNTIPDNNYSKYTNIYVKGQLCITPVYNYGMTERKDILTDSQVQGCSVYYDDFSLNRMYILKEDVKNHAIYYLKAYDTSKENVVKIDTSIFNISYITENDKDNPLVSIGGKNYPTLSYDTLTDSATISQNNGYTPGISCAVGDMNCYKDNNTDNIFDDLFSNPLEFFKDVFSSVKSIFDIVVKFIALLPPMMQSFLYLSFMLAIILGLIKIIL